MPVTLKMRDPTAQTEPLTAGQKVVAQWETDGSLFEPCELAQLIDDAIEAEREACAKLADEGAYYGTAEGAEDMAKTLAKLIRARA